MLVFVGCVCGFAGFWFRLGFGLGVIWRDLRWALWFTSCGYVAVVCGSSCSVWLAVWWFVGSFAEEGVRVLLGWCGFLYGVWLFVVGFIAQCCCLGAWFWLGLGGCGVGFQVLDRCVGWVAVLYGCYNTAL